MSFLNKVYNRYLSSDKDLVGFIKAITGITPNRLNHYRLVFRHRSKYSDSADNNERLELLGDSILDAIVSEYLYKKYPYKEEGFLTDLRSKIVSRKQLNDLGEKLGLVNKLEYHRRSMQEAGRDLAGNTFEALIGAIYLDTGFEGTKKFLLKRVLQRLIDVDNLERTDVDYKSKMYHYIQKEGKKLAFIVEQEEKRNFKTHFTIRLEINEEAIATGEGYSKKVAEQSAALNAINKLGLEDWKVEG